MVPAVVCGKTGVRNAVPILGWAGALTGVIGAGMLAVNAAWSGWGFVAFLASNVFWTAHGLATRTFSLVVMQAAFTATSLLGIYRWLWTTE